MQLQNFVLLASLETDRRIDSWRKNPGGHKQEAKCESTCHPAWETTTWRISFRAPNDGGGFCSRGPYLSCLWFGPKWIRAAWQLPLPCKQQVKQAEDQKEKQPKNPNAAVDANILWEQNFLQHCAHKWLCVCVCVSLAPLPYLLPHCSCASLNPYKPPAALMQHMGARDSVCFYLPASSLVREARLSVDLT